MEIWTLFPKFNGGLNILGVCMLSDNNELVKKTIETLYRLSTTQTAREIISNLNQNLLSLYYSKASQIVTN